MDRKVELAMNCSICGGLLKYENGLYVCTNCGSKQQEISVFENTEVYICYVENDLQGRRAKESVIAQDIYNKLQNLNINVFYQRISASNLFGENLKKVCKISISRASAIIVCATSKENFIKLLEENREDFINKRVIPVYSSIGAYDIPEEFRKLQAVNYDNIGSILDLGKNLLHFLGKKSEIDILSVVNEQIHKKRKRLTISIYSIVVILILGLSYVVFGTPYVLKSKKYCYAEKLVSTGNYVDAIDIFTQLENYKNSQGILKSIYDKYEGYYHDETQTIGLHLKIDNISNVNIEIVKNISQNQIIKINEKSTISNSNIEFTFNDNRGKEGNSNIELKDDKIILIVEFFAEPQNNIEVVFDLNKKSDKPILNKINANVLLSWLSEKKTLSSIKSSIYDIVEVRTLTPPEQLAKEYRIENTDIFLEMFYWDITKDTYTSYDKWLDDETLFAVQAPAEVICPDRIGQADDPFLDVNFNYYPNGIRYSYGKAKGTTITEKTPIVVTLRNTLLENKTWLPYDCAEIDEFRYK